MNWQIDVRHAQDSARFQSELAVDQVKSTNCEFMGRKRWYGFDFKHEGDDNKYMAMTMHW